MANTIKLKRGLASNIKNISLEQGELAITTDTGEIYSRKDSKTVKIVPTKTSELINDIGFITGIPSEYITETELNNKGYLTNIPSEYVTDSELAAKGYATTTYVDNKVSGMVTSASITKIEKVTEYPSNPDANTLYIKVES